MKYGVKKQEFKDYWDANYKYEEAEISTSEADEILNE
jgi:hypothetical protein